MPRTVAPDWAGYGYELLVITEKPEKWPLLALEAAARRELVQDVGLLEAVNEHGAALLDEVAVGGDRQVALLVVPATDALAPNVELPNGAAHLLVAIALQPTEQALVVMVGAGAGAQQLRHAGLALASRLDRAPLA